MNTATEAAQGLVSRAFGWGVGILLGVVGAVTTIRDLLTHHHGIGPYLLAAGLTLLFLAALDMWRVERRNKHAEKARADGLDADLTTEKTESARLLRDRDEWQRLHAQEAAENRRLMVELFGQRVPQQETKATVATTSPFITTSYPYTVQESFIPPGWPGYEEPPDPDQGTLFRPENDAI